VSELEEPAEDPVGGVRIVSINRDRDNEFDTGTMSHKEGSLNKEGSQAQFVL